MVIISYLTTPVFDIIVIISVVQTYLVIYSKLIQTILILGDRETPAFRPDYGYAWISLYQKHMRYLPKQDCVDLSKIYEARVAKFGYSLVQFKKVSSTPYIADVLLEGFK